MANPPTLPPSALTGAQANARIDQIAVRIINLPDGLKNNASAVRVKGTVNGQNQDGSLNIKTDKGDINILLKDKGNLPTGTKIDIDIPAGRAPQQANIRPSAENATPNATPNTTPSLARTVAETQIPSQQVSSQQTSLSQTNTLENNAKLNSNTLGSVITSAQNLAVDDAPLPIPIAGGTLQPGQITRFLPIPPGSLPDSVQKLLAKPLSVPQLVAGLVDVIENLPKAHIETRTALITILSRLDLSTLTTQATQQANQTQSALAQPTAQQPQNPLLTKIGTLLQSVGLTPNFKIDTNAPISSAPQNLSVFNPSKAIDGQILAVGGTPTLGTSAAASTGSQINVIPQTVKEFAPPTTPVSPAQVLGFTDAKLPVLSVPLPHTGLTQLYTMQFKADNLAAGSPVFIALDPTSLRPTQTIFARNADGTLNTDAKSLPALMQLIGGSVSSPNTDTTWDSLDTLLKTLIHSTSTSSLAQGQNFAQMLPSPAQAQNMGALSLFFLSVLRTGGSVDDWIPNQAISLLKEMGKLDTLRSVATDISLSSKLDSLSLPQDWRMAMLPLLWEQNVHRLPLYYKHFPDDGEKDDGDGKKRRKLRFLFDLNLSRMGGVQVDGFMQSERLDLILRTKTPLSRPMQVEMKRIYAGAMDKSRLTGDLSFQFKPEHWVDFSKDFEKSGVNA